MGKAISQEELAHNSRLLIKAGISNTEMVTREYGFTADNHLDYTASIASATTVTFSELPTNTTWIHVYFGVFSGTRCQLDHKPKSTDSLTKNLAFGTTGSLGGTNLGYGNFWLKTYQNSIYIVTKYNTLQYFRIFGYKVKE